MSALGDTFRAARESQGLTLPDVAERTHIRSLYLEAIEAEDWSSIGPPVYVRGFLRTYARCLGLDPEAAVARFVEYGSGSPRSAAAPELTPRAEPLLVRSRAQRGLSPGAVVGVAVAFALVLFVGYQFIDYQRGRTLPAATSSPAARPERRTQPGRAERKSEPAAAAVRAADVRPDVKTDEHPSGFTVRLRDGSWIKVVVDGKVAMEGLYPKGTQRTFAGRSATVRVGNAGGVDVWVDGKDLGPMGGLGDVAERSFQL